MKLPPLPVTGGLSAPPADAPVETTAPLQRDAGGVVYQDPATGAVIGSMTPAERAAQNEQQLQPLAFLNRPQVIQPGPTPEPATDVPLGTAATTAADARSVASPAPVVAAPVLSAPKPPKAQPAASNTDTPSRGIPQMISDPRKKIGGGFGMPDQAYYALNGEEMRALVTKLMDELHARIQNDLRFSLATTYPRIAVTLELKVEADVGQGGFNITKTVEQGEMPLEVARQFHDKVVFVLLERRQEFSKDGEVESPADAIRDELGIEKPRKHLVSGPVPALVDVLW